MLLISVQLERNLRRCSRFRSWVEAWLFASVTIVEPAILRGRLWTAEPIESESRARKNRTDDDQIPLPGGTAWKAAAAATSLTWSARMAQGDADAGVQRHQYAR